MTTDIPSELKYTNTHEWVKDEGDGTVTVGLTETAQTMLGDLVFVELPEVGNQVDAGDDCAVVESVKSASDVYAPIGGEILEVNASLVETPELVNRDPYQDGWLMRIKINDADELNSLLDAAQYQEHVSTDDVEESLED